MRKVRRRSCERIIIGLGNLSVMTDDDDDTWKKIVCGNFNVVDLPAQDHVLLKLALLPSSSPASTAVAAAATLETVGEILTYELESKKELFYGDAEGDYRGQPLNLCATLIVSSSSSMALLESPLSTLVMLSKLLNWRFVNESEVGVLAKTMDRRYPDLEYPARLMIHQITHPFLPVIRADPEASAELFDDVFLTLVTLRPRQPPN
ncbi:unnamed protein product [Cuscuta campestris]|uniref:Uncharacterized protein n=1 Tax=Cuscuta campestris TaxID=132261 RepID=A0A484LPG4_9ASTE|nr:unnamed protein product [Cuscuta campestris]